MTLACTPLVEVQVIVTLPVLYFLFAITVTLLPELPTVAILASLDFQVYFWPTASGGITSCTFTPLLSPQASLKFPVFNLNEIIDLLVGEGGVLLAVWEAFPTETLEESTLLPIIPVVPVTEVFEFATLLVTDSFIFWFSLAFSSADLPLEVLLYSELNSLLIPELIPELVAVSVIFLYTSEKESPTCPKNFSINLVCASRELLNSFSCLSNVSCSFSVKSS